MELARPARAKGLISLVPLVDVLLIMLVFFMVTSTYLDLDMIPAVERGDEEDAAAAATPAEGPEGASGVLLLRLAPDGRVWLRGQALSEAGLRDALAAHLRDAPAGSVSVLASPRAETQALVGLMDLATDMGVPGLRVLRTEGPAPEAGP